MGAVWRHAHIIAAAIFSIVLVGGAFYLAQGTAASSPSEASDQAAALAAIANKDSTGDGLPDWEKALYGIPLNATTTDYFHLGMTDGEAVARGLLVPKAVADISFPTSTLSATQISAEYGLPPPAADNTLTAAFSKNFFTLYLQEKEANGGGNLTNDQMQTIAQQALASLSGTISSAPPFKQASDLTISGTGQTALRSFAQAAELVFTKNTAEASTSEVNYLRDTIQNNDQSAIPHIASISQAYRKTAAGLAQLATPTELASPELALINALAHLGEITSDFTQVNSDPMAAMLALEQYAQAVQDLGNAFIAIGKVYADEGVTFGPNDPGASFVNMAADLTTSQASTSPATSP